MWFLRKLLFYTGKNELIKEKLPFTSDMYIWLLRRVCNEDNVLESGILSIKTIRGFKGDTEDSLNTISAKGECVTNILSTLSFIIESKKVNQINLEVSYREHTNIDITLNDKSSLDISFDRYTGEFLQDNIEIERNAKICLILYIEIIPKIVKNYKNCKEMNDWNEDACINFLQDVADDLKQKINCRMDSLRKGPKQLSLKIS